MGKLPNAHVTASRAGVQSGCLRGAGTPFLCPLPSQRWQCPIPTKQKRSTNWDLGPGPCAAIGEWKSPPCACTHRPRGIRSP